MCDVPSILLLLLLLLLSSRNTESLIKGLWWAGYVAGREGMRYTCIWVMGNLVRMSPLWRPAKGWEDDVRLTTGQNVGGGGGLEGVVNYLVTYLILGLDRISVVATFVLVSLFSCLLQGRAATLCLLCCVFCWCIEVGGGCVDKW